MTKNERQKLDDIEDFLFEEMEKNLSNLSDAKSPQEELKRQTIFDFAHEIYQKIKSI